jgi:RHS repeat-associated protein
MITGQLLAPWRYAGKRFDNETGLIYFGERYYDRSTRCWLTPDPLEDGDGPNLYCYVHNNPLYYTDPDGRFAFAAP